MTTADLARLRALAEAAQRGPWEVAFAGEHSRVLAQQGDGVWREIDADRGGKSRANAAFIAACSPTTVLALLDEIARLTASAAEVRRGAIEECAGVVTGDRRHMLAPVARDILDAAVIRLRALLTQPTPATPTEEPDGR